MSISLLFSSIDHRTQSCSTDFGKQISRLGKNDLLIIKLNLSILFRIFSNILNVLHYIS